MQDKLNLDAYVESVMLHELSLTRTIQRSENQLILIQSTTTDSDQSALSSSDEFKKAIDEAKKLLVSRNVWRMTALVTGGIALVLGVIAAVK